MNKVLTDLLLKVSKDLGIESPKINLGHPEDIKHGDYTSNLAMIYAKDLKMAPKALAEKIVESIKKDLPKNVEKVEVAGPGFINFIIKDKYFVEEMIKVSKDLENFGKNKKDHGKKIMVEYTDPNPFKVFHIGHLMANAIGETLSRVIEFSGAKVVHACYQGDVGLHVAKTIWAILKDGNFKKDIHYLGQMYVLGNLKYEDDEKAKQEIIEINKKVFDGSDKDVNKVYEAGRKLSLEYFDDIYKKLDTKFDNFFFESEVAEEGVKIVQEFLKKEVFEMSDGAVIFPGEKYGLHTRVFINSQGLPTYEAKELGLTQEKFRLYPDLKESLVVTANEQDAYFKVLIECIREISPDIASKMKHLSHGILRPSSGKMSSRKGNVVSADDLIEEFEKLVEVKIKDREFDEAEKKKIKEEVAIAAIKYTVLRQAIGGDVIYDPEKAVSFEGDAGPYLQYAAVRAEAVLKKARESKVEDKIEDQPETLPEKVSLLEKLILRFPEVIERAREEYAPHHIVTYLIDLAGAFNSYYAHHPIVGDNYRVTLTKVFKAVMTNGLWVLGIKVPDRM